jgi:flavin reductase (DIM6/NTAB) family NADH-FMN oxidoreductase RutF
MKFTKEDILGLEHIYKINLVNSISGFKSANLIATKSTTGVTNVGVFSSVVHLGSEPPLFGFVLRPTTVKRDTYNNIKETGYYTINHITEAIAEDAHHTSASYDAFTSEFDKTDLEEEYLNNFYAPFVKQSPVKLAFKYVSEYPIVENDTILVVGELIEFHVNNDMLQEDGFIDLSKGNVVAITSLDGYSKVASSKRFPYQRPNKRVNK